MASQARSRTPPTRACPLQMPAAMAGQACSRAVRLRACPLQAFCTRALPSRGRRLERIAVAMVRREHSRAAPIRGRLPHTCLSDQRLHLSMTGTEPATSAALLGRDQCSKMRTAAQALTGRPHGRASCLLCPSYPKQTRATRPSCAGTTERAAAPAEMAAPLRMGIRSCARWEARRCACLSCPCVIAVACQAGNHLLVWCSMDGNIIHGHENAHPPLFWIYSL